MFDTYDIHLRPFVKLIVGHITWWSWTLEGVGPNQHHMNCKLKLRQLKLKIGLRI